MTDQTTPDEAVELADAPIDDDTDAPAAPEGPRLFDFRRPNKFSREHVRALSLVHESFARQFGTVLSATLRSVSHVSVGSIEQLSYDDYVDTSPNPSLLAVVSLEPLAEIAILQIPLPLAMCVLDRMLGGAGTGPYPARALTDVEENLITEVIDRCLGELAAAFDSLITIQPRLVDLESNPNFVHVAAGSDLVVVVAFETTVGDTQGRITLCVPFAELEPQLGTIAGGPVTGDRRAGELAAAAIAMDLALHDVPIEVSVRFAPVSLTSAEVVDLQVGDVLALRHPCDQPLTVLAGDIPLLPAVAGRKRNRLACRIVESDLEGVS